MGDNEQLQFYSKPFFVFPPSLRKEVETQKQNLLNEISNAISKPWHIKDGFICVDEVMSKDDLYRIAAKGVSVFSSNGIPLRTNITTEDLFALRIKRNKKHYKPKFTL